MILSRSLIRHDNNEIGRKPFSGVVPFGTGMIVALFRTSGIPLFAHCVNLSVIFCMIWSSWQSFLMCRYVIPSLAGENLRLTQFKAASTSHWRIWMVLGNSGEFEIFSKIEYCDPPSWIESSRVMNSWSSARISVGSASPSSSKGN